MRYFSAISPHATRPVAQPSMEQLAEALRASWDASTAYRGEFDAHNPARGQCYPTARVVQWYFPDFDVACGEVWTGSNLERHFWNVAAASGCPATIDLTWEQFPSGSKVERFEMLGTGPSADSNGTQDRCMLLLARVERHLRQD